VPAHVLHLQLTVESDCDSVLAIEEAINMAISMTARCGVLVDLAGRRAPVAYCIVDSEWLPVVEPEMHERI
jgi:hypothetical protein